MALEKRALNPMTRRPKPNFLEDIEGKQAHLNHVSGVIHLTMKRLQKKMKTHDQANLLDKLRARLQSRRKLVEGDSDEDDASDWSVQ